MLLASNLEKSLSMMFILSMNAFLKVCNRFYTSVLILSYNLMDGYYRSLQLPK